MLPSTSAATATLPAQDSRSAENAFRRAMLSIDTPTTVAPAATNLSWLTANSCAWILHSLVKALGKK